MKTTLDLPDTTYRKAKAYAAGQGISLKQFVTEALEEKIRLSGIGRASRRFSPPWMVGFGGLADLVDENRRVLSAIEEEFETIDPEPID